jgi:hypothetical protein
MVGWRGYSFARPHFLTTQGTVIIPHERSEAYCTVAQNNEQVEDHLAPKEECTCGFYATKTLTQLLNQGYGGQDFLCEVYMWGKVCEYTEGYRSQYIYPARLYGRNSLLQHYGPYLADVYGVPYNPQYVVTFAPQASPGARVGVPVKQPALTFEELWNIAFNNAGAADVRRFARNQIRQRVYMKLRASTIRKRNLEKEYGRVVKKIKDLELQMQLIDELKNNIK